MRILIDSPFTLYAPETMLREIRKYESEILERSGLDKDNFEILFKLVSERIIIVEKEEYTQKLSEADKLLGAIDKGDVPFLALALSTPNHGIWTENIKHFGKQNKVKVWTTKDVLMHLKNKINFNNNSVYKY